MKALAWAIIIAGFMISYAIEWASGRVKTEKHMAFDGATFLFFLVGFLLACLFGAP